MKILLISRSFYPENSPRSFRATELAKEFARQGHEVTVITPNNADCHFKIEKEYGIKIKDLGKPRFKVPDFGKSKIGFILTRAFVRFFSLTIEYPSIELMFMVRRALRYESTYDIMISIAVPYSVHWGVAWARSQKNKIAKVWVADCGDPYMGCKTDTFKKLFYFKYPEKWFCRKADYISIPNKDHLSQYYSEFHYKFRFIPQGFRFEDSKIFEGEIKNEVPTFAFAGVLLRGKRDPSLFLEYLSSVNKKFKFIFYTKNIGVLEPYLSILGNKMEIRDYIPRQELLYELSKMDFLIHIDFHSSVESNSPSKLVDYAIVKRPILQINTENLNTAVVDEFLDGNFNNKFKLTNTDKFRIENVVKDFISLNKND